MNRIPWDRETAEILNGKTSEEAVIWMVKKLIQINPEDAQVQAAVRKLGVDPEHMSYQEASMTIWEIREPGSVEPEPLPLKKIRHYNKVLEQYPDRKSRDDRYWEYRRMKKKAMKEWRKEKRHARSGKAGRAAGADL